MLNLVLIILFIISQIQNTKSVVLINQKSYLIVQWSAVGPFSTNLTDVLLSPSGNNVSGRVVYVPAPRFNGLVHINPWLKVVSDLQRNGCIGILTSNPNRPLPGMYCYGTIGGNFPLPVGVVSSEFSQYLSTLPGNNASFQFIAWDPNPFDPTNTGTGYALFTAFIVLMFISNTIYAGYRIIMWVKRLRENGEFEFTIGFACLILECLCNLIRSIQTALVTFHNNYAIAGIDTIVTLSICINLISSILIIYFWLDLTSDPFYQGKFLGVMKIPAIVTIIILIIIEIAFDILRNTTPLEFSIIMTLLYFILHLIVVIFNIVAGIRILITMNKQEDNKKKKLPSITKRILTSSVVTFFGVIIFLLFLVDSLFTNPNTPAVLWTLLFITFWLQSLLLIMIFKLPKQKNTSNSHKLGRSATSSTKETDAKEMEENET